MKKQWMSLFVVLFGSLFASFQKMAWATPSAADILSKADAIRFPAGDHRVKVRVAFARPGRSPDVGQYDVLTKGYAKTLIETKAPATERGNSFLMLDRALWIFARDVSQPVRVSFQQRLLGDVANGDLARANFVGDYTPTLVKVTPQYYVLNLQAKNEEVTYDRVIFVVEKNTLRPHTAQFFAASGKLLKTGTYDHYQMMAGAMRPTRLVFENPLIKGQTSVITYDDMVSENQPDKYFTKDYLKKLKY